MEAGKNKTNIKKLEINNSDEREGTHGEVKWEERPGDSSQRNEYKSTTRPYKPKSTIKTGVVLNDTAL